MENNYYLELLAPAKNLEFGKAAINHGADAVYVGAPRFGARSAAGNSIADIAQLVDYAHVFNAKVFVTVNTLLFDDELEDARKMIYELYEAGADAIIIQDMGILEMDLPPIQIHASTQMHNISPEKVLFLEKAGFQRVTLPRELSVNEIMDIRKNTTVELECFIHGALCVCYSGQCYMSLSINGRSGNRGECSQPCRSKYDLLNEKGDVLVHDKHLLSLRDFNASQYLKLLAAAGISSFKIEGRLKDLSYVKNVTAYYRQLIDNLGDNYHKTSSGTTIFSFAPDPERTFNRGFTTYMLDGFRSQMASYLTQKSLGKKVGKVLVSYTDAIRAELSEELHNGDGLCFFNNEGLDGFLVNRFQNNIITPNKPVNVKKGTILYRNNDMEFERTLQRDDSAERKIAVNMEFTPSDSGFGLKITDEDGCTATASVTLEHTPANNAEKVRIQIRQQLSKLGQTPFKLVEFVDNSAETYFIPASVLNELRRMCVENLLDVRRSKFKSDDMQFEKTDVPYISREVDYRTNITNKLAVDFYHRHHVTELEAGPDSTRDCSDIVLMTTKYCLRYEMGQCLKSKNVDEEYKGRLFLENNGKRYELKFDCAKCQMNVINVSRGSLLQK